MNPLEYADWDSLLGTHPQSSFFHTVAWIRILSETYGCTPVFFVVVKDRCLHAMMPVVELASWASGRRGVALPFTDTCDPLDREHTLKRKVLPEVLRHGCERRWKYFECRGGRDVFGEVPPFQTFFIHEMKLFKDERYLFSRLDSGTRRAVRKAQKAGVTIEISQTLEATRQYYSLHCKTRRRHGLPPQPFAFFRKIHEHVLEPRKGIVVLARHCEHIIAGAIYFHFDQEAIYRFGASDEAFQDLRGNNLVMWAAIKWYTSKGSKTLHFGRTSISNEGLRRFKLGWGAEERRIEYVRYDLRRKCYLSGKDAAFGWHNSIFRILPLSVSRYLGAVLYRHVA